MPGAWGGILLEERRLLEKGRVDGQGGGVQLLSRKESGGVWRSRSRHHERRGACAQDQDAARPRPSPKVLSRHGRIQRTSRRDSGGDLANQTAVPGSVERGAPGKRPSLSGVPWLG